MSDLLRSIVALQVEALSTLNDLGTVRGLQRRLDDMGHDDILVTEDLAAALALGTAITDLIDSLRGAVLSGSPAPEDLPGLVEQVIEVVQLIRAFDPNVSLAPFDQPGFAEEFALYLLDDMLRQILRRRFPRLGLLLHVVGAIRMTQKTVAGRVQPVERIDLSALADFVGDPAGSLNARFGLGVDFWSGPELEHLASHLVAAGLSVVRGRLSDEDVDGVSTIALDPGDLHYDIMLLRGAMLGSGVPLEAGLRLMPRIDQAKLGLGVVASDIARSARIALSPAWHVDLELDTDATVLATVSEAGLEPEPISPTISAVLSASEPHKMILVGTPGATRLELARFELGGAITFGSGADARLELALEGLALVVSAADGLMTEIIGAGFETTVDLAVAWSARDGLTFGGSAGLQYTLPAETALGPITLRDVTIEVAARDSGPALVASADVAARFGPFDATVGGLGIAVLLEEAPDGVGLIGPYLVSAGAKLPDALGLSIDIPSVAGGGFLEIEGGRYSGALALDVISVGIAAITVIDTDLPDMPGGYAFFASLSLEFPAIPLGFGFTLSGLGGLIALNRGIDTVAIAAGLKNGAVDALLFPDDPVRDAPLLIAMIDDYFPPESGNTVVGPVVEIGWGAPKTLITAQLGVVISIPEGRIALLGSIEALLPDPLAPLLTLRMDLLGEVDLPAGTLFMTASLYDSQLLDTIELSGDMGAFLATQGRPYFLLSVGGYNPGFEPPSLVPAPLHDLRRMSAAIRIGPDVRLTIECYFALTSNSLQFGATVELVMTATVALKTYTARGGLEFHILLRFSPFQIVAEVSAHVGVYSGSRSLMEVYLGATLEGPAPWYAVGRAEFRFFGIKVKFRVEVGGQAAAEAKPRVALRPDVMAALRDPASWSEAPSLSGAPSLVTFLDPPGPIDGQPVPVWVRPDRLVAVSQSVAPLDKTIEVVGQGLPAAGDERMEITDAGIGGVSVAWERLQDYFAPAQFEQLGKKEKLSRASFEEMTAGVSFGDPRPRVTPHAALCRTAPDGYEEQWYETQAARVLDMHLLDPATALAGSAAAQALNARTARQTGLFEVAPVAYGVADALNGSDLVGTLGTGGTSQAAALSAGAAFEGAAEGVVVVGLASLEAAA